MPAYMHASIATPGLAANHHTGNGRDYLRIVKRPDAHIIFPSTFTSTRNSTRELHSSTSTELQQRLYNFRHSYPRVIIFKLIYFTLAGISPPDKSKRGKLQTVLLHTTQTSRTRLSQLNAVWYQSHFIPQQKDEVGVF